MYYELQYRKFKTFSVVFTSIVFFPGIQQKIQVMLGLVNKY